MHSVTLPSLWASDCPDKAVVDLLGTLPRRWGRMDPLSRLALVGVGAALNKSSWHHAGVVTIPLGLTVGLVAATRWGSLSTDLTFCRTFAEDPLQASPTLFSYTLPSVPLSEVASHFGLRGPVYSIFGNKDLFFAAQTEAQSWLGAKNGIDTMIYGVLDMPPPGFSQEEPCAEFTLASRGTPPT